MTAFRLALVNSWPMWLGISIALGALWYPVLHEWWTARRGR